MTVLATVVVASNTLTNGDEFDISFVGNFMDINIEQIKKGHHIAALQREIYQACPALEYGKALHPLYKGLTSKVCDIIIELNDSFEWTREQIADWLDTLDIDLTVTV
jgi:hypothetical protein